MRYKNGVKNKKPRNLAATKLRGNVKGIGNSNYTSLDLQKAIYEKGIELYRQGKVRIDSNGYFKVNGYQVDTEKVTCECPDYRERKEPCKHFFAACLFQKDGGKAKRKHLKGYTNGNGTTKEYDGRKGRESEKRVEPGFDSQATITKLAVLNTATEILRAHDDSIKLEEVFFLARQLEAWAMRS